MAQDTAGNVGYSTNKGFNFLSVLDAGGPEILIDSPLRAPSTRPARTCPRATRARIRPVSRRARGRSRTARRSTRRRSGRTPSGHVDRPRPGTRADQTFDRTRGQLLGSGSQLYATTTVRLFRSNGASRITAPRRSPSSLQRRARIGARPSGRAGIVRHDSTSDGMNALRQVRRRGYRYLRSRTDDAGRGVGLDARPALGLQLMAGHRAVALRRGVREPGRERVEAGAGGGQLRHRRRRPRRGGGDVPAPEGLGDASRGAAAVLARARRRRAEPAVRRGDPAPSCWSSSGGRGVLEHPGEATEPLAARSAARAAPASGAARTRRGRRARTRARPR